MVTKIYKVDGDDILNRALLDCAAILKNGGTVALPTETVYGLAANGLDDEAVGKLYLAKNRPPIKPISLAVADLAMAERVAVFDDRARLLFNSFLPGPLTLVLPKKNTVPDIVSAGLDSVGIRVPDHPIALGVVRACGLPLALTSANLSGCPSVTEGGEVVKTLSGRVDAIIDGGPCRVGTESTIISLVGQPKLLRRGAIPFEKIMEALK